MSQIFCFGPIFYFILKKHISTLCIHVFKVICVIISEISMFQNMLNENFPIWDTFPKTSYELFDH